MVSGACEAHYVKDYLEYMVKGNYNVEARLRGDSAAGRGIAQRVGCGRVRHLDAGLLWLQQAVKERMFKVGAIAGEPLRPWNQAGSSSTTPGASLQARCC